VNIVFLFVQTVSTPIYIQLNGANNVFGTVLVTTTTTTTTTTTIVFTALCPDYLGEPVPEETLTHPPS